MLLFGVLGLAFAGGETKAQKNTVVIQKKVRRTRQSIKRKKKIDSSRRSRSQNSPSSHGNHMYTPSQSQSTTHDYSVPVNRGQYDRDVPKRTPRTSSGTTQQKSRVTTDRRYTDSSTWGSTPRTTSTTSPNQTRTTTSTTVRQNIPTGSSTRRDRQTTTTRRDRSTPVSTSTTRRERKRRTSTTSQEQSTPVSTSTTRRDRRRRTTTTRTYPKQTPNIQQEETSSSQTRRRRVHQGNESSSNYTSRTRSNRTEPNSYRPRQRQQSSNEDSCYSSTTRVGIRGGQHALEMNDESVNTGTGWAVGFQPCDDIFEMELSHVSFGDGFAIGVDSPVQLTAQLYGSTSGLAPFVSFGLHGAKNDLVKEIGFMDDEVLIGMHGGLGLRYKVGPLSVTMEGRYGSYLDQDFSQIQGIAGLNLHF